MSLDRRKMISLGAGSAALAMAGSAASATPATATPTLAASASATPRRHVPGDAELARSLSGGFRSQYAHVNGVRLHYVAGGHGPLLVLVAGWPQTWWSYRKIMPALARRYRVIAVDLRGQGGSDKPQGGYDKKTMARDIHELVRHLGHRRTFIAGHDIGAKVAFSFAANHPDATRKVAMLDTLHPDESFYDVPLLQRPGGPFNLWWWAFNQVHGLPEQLIQGRSRHLIDWFLANSLHDQSLVTDFDRNVYARTYDTPDGIRAANGWYQSFAQDIEDIKTYPKLTPPLLGLASDQSYTAYVQTLPKLATDVRVVRFENTVHYLQEEAPERVLREFLEFFV
ncbi:alpha/beta hydrolase [Streptomyces sp. NPDC020719]|uniref:alpha/beta fold hydrolase n=1 Tax=unclassified Streptomyces TaxID=2593676 RepID=UPI0033E70A89